MKLYPHQTAALSAIILDHDPGYRAPAGRYTLKAVDEGHHFPTRRELVPPPLSLMSVVRSALARLSVVLYGPALVPKEPEGEEVLFCPACDEPKTRFDVHVAAVSNTRSLPVVLR